ncbi:MAG: DUF262 domain-containing protein [Clostridia bacterium]|nr:DUF262 domain-containing protein [Clostridia bacterium]
MNIKKYDFEVNTIKRISQEMNKSQFDINAKYEQGYSRVVTETGSYKVSIIKEIFKQGNYNLQPDYQRRITWNANKRSKLIESLIVNIPIPPIFLYEYDYDKYEVMDGLQRLTAIIDFYDNKYRLSGLEEWEELDGKKYKDLPEKVKEGIDRRQIQVVTLLKESATTAERADKIRRLVFERLNTGGVKLLPQEIRNAVYNGPGNDMCIKLSNNVLFKSLWEIPKSTEIDEEDYDLQDQIDDDSLRRKLDRNALFKRMYDVELVLRFFAMRNINDFDYALSSMLDDTLYALNRYNGKQLNDLSNLFAKTLKKANDLFGLFAFKIYNSETEKWSSPSRMIYDPMMLALTNEDICFDSTNSDVNINKLKAFYTKCNKQEDGNIADERLFDGKHQAKTDIIKRTEKLYEFIKNEIL